MQDECVQWFSDRLWPLRIEFRLETAFETAQRVFGVRVFLADHIDRQLVVLNESHVRSLSAHGLAGTTADAAVAHPPTLHGGFLFCAPADPMPRLCNRPSILSLQCRFLVWQRAGNDAELRKARSTRCLLLQPEAWRTTSSGSTAVWLHRDPYIGDIGALQTSVSIERQFSRIPPAFPRSLARCLSRARRHVDVLLRLRRPSGLGFQTKISRATGRAAAAQLRARFFFGASAESTSRPWERGTLASLRARVSRG